jgi:hypothetical protein
MRWVDPKLPSSIALLSIVLTVLGVVLFGRISGEGHWIADLSNSAHGPAFALVTLILIVLLRRMPHRHASVLRDYLLAMAVTVLLGALIELLQLLTGGDASFDDLGRDTLGAVAATGFLSLCDPQLRNLHSHRAIRRSGLLLGVASTAIVLVPLTTALAAYLQRQCNFPTLVDFSSPLGTYFVGAYSTVAIKREALPNAVTGGAYRTVGLRVRLGKSQRWSVVVWEPYPDWRSYEKLAIDLANPTNVPLLLQMRVRDRSQRGEGEQSGYIGAIEIAPRSRRTHLVALREMTQAKNHKPINFAMVDAILLTQNSANRVRDFYIMRIWLE